MGGGYHRAGLVKFDYEGGFSVRRGDHRREARKTYRGAKGAGTAALDGLDLTVARGTVHAVLGPNGAGKTTLVRVLSTLLRPDSGRVVVAGHDVVREAYQVRLRIGLLGQHAALDEELGGRQNLELFGRLYHLGARRARARADELLERFGLSGTGAKAVARYSGGMRRRLDLAASLSTEPEVLFPDEPTTGLDPPPVLGFVRTGGTPMAARRCGTRCAPWSAAGRRSCSPPSTWRS